MEKINSFTFGQMDVDSARAIAGWRYDPPYDVYNGDADDVEAEIQGFLNPQYHYHTVWAESGELVGYCCFGEDGQVPGGDYRGDALDVGAGLRPDHTGRGLGSRFLAAILAFSRQLYAPAAFRATVAAFNQRALRACAKVGFRPVQEFTSTHTGKSFVILVRYAKTE
jgi:RimJ/RimL family protein N-acetyltransferase